MKQRIKAVFIFALTAMTGMATVAEEFEIKSYDHLTLNNLPTVGSVIEAAMDTLPDNLGQVTDYTSRMRWSTLLPQFQARYRMFQDVLDQYDEVYRTETRTESRDIDRVVGDPFDSYNENYYSRYTETDGPYAQNRDDELKWAEDVTLIATWNLYNLIYNNDELEAAQVNRFIADFRIKYMQNIANLYGKLQAALDTLDSAPKNRRAQSQRDIHATMLDQLTDGFVYKASLSAGSAAPEPSVGKVDSAALKPAPIRKSNDQELAPENGKLATTAADAEASAGLVPSVSAVPGTAAAYALEDEEVEEEQDQFDVETTDLEIDRTDEETIVGE